MEAKRFIPDIQPEENHQDSDVLSTRMTRRQLFSRAAAVGLLPVIGSAAIYQEGKNRRTQEFHSQFWGYRDISDAAFYELTESYSNTVLHIAHEEIEDTSQPREIEFTLNDDDSTVIVTLVGAKAETLHPRPILITNGQDRTYLAPLIEETEDQKKLPVAINIGKHDAGTHKISVVQDFSSSLPTSDPIQVYISVPDKNALLTSYIEHAPVLIIKNKENVLDDMPLVMFSKIKRKENRIQILSDMVISSENGGTKPPVLQRDLGRVVDIEWVMNQIFSDSGDIVDGLERYQTINHGNEKFEGRKIDSQPVLYIATPNNNFSDADNISFIAGKTFENPLGDIIDFVTGNDNSDEKEIYYSPVPLFVPGRVTSNDILAMYPQLKILGLYEVALENCVDLSNTEDPTVQRFLDGLVSFRGPLTTKYPDRGCGDTKVTLES